MQMLFSIKMHEKAVRIEVRYFKIRLVVLFLNSDDEIVNEFSSYLLGDDIEKDIEKVDP